MLIRTFRAAKHKGCNIYFRQFGDTFEYLLVARQQIFTDNVRVKPGLAGRIMFFLKKARTPYREVVLQNVLSVLMGRASERADYVLSKQYEQDLKKMEREAGKEARKIQKQAKRS